MDEACDEEGVFDFSALLGDTVICTKTAFIWNVGGESKASKTLNIDQWLYLNWSKALLLKK